MANLTNIPAIDWFETTLSASWNGAVGTVSVNDVPSGTIESGETSYIVVNPWKANMQVVQIDWRDSGAKTFNVISISVEKGNGVNYTAQSHAANSVVRFSNNYAFWKDIRTAINSKAGTDTDNTWTWTQTVDKLVATGYIKDAVYADATARDTAIPSPSNGMRIYNTAVWLFQKYQAGAWIDDTSWASTPNASTTVAGKVEKATAWEVTAGTSTGGTWAELFVWPAQLKTVTDALVVPDATDTVKGKVELATNAEALAWTDTTRAVTPAWLATAIAWEYDITIDFRPVWTWGAILWGTQTATSTLSTNSMLWKFSFTSWWSSNRELYTEMPILVAWWTYLSVLQRANISKIEFEWFVAWTARFGIWFWTSTAWSFSTTASTQRKVLISKTWATNAYVNINTSDWTTCTQWSNCNMASTHALSNRYKLIYDVTWASVQLFVNGTLANTKTTNLPTWANDVYFWFGIEDAINAMWLSWCKIKIKYV